MRRLLLSSVAFVSLSLGACGGPPAPAPTPSPAVPPGTSPPVEAAATAIDLSEVPIPGNLAFQMRIAKPSAIVDVARAWTGLPVPSASELMAQGIAEVVKAKLADLIDVDQPVDAVATLAISGRNPDAEFAIALGLKDLVAAKAMLSSVYTLAPTTNGAIKIDLHSGSSANEKHGSKSDLACSLMPTAGKAAGQVVCGTSQKSVDDLAPYLTRTLARTVPTTDLSIELRNSRTIRTGITLAKTLGGPYLAGEMEKGGLPPAARELVNDLIDEAAAFSEDLDVISEEAKLSDAGIKWTQRVAFASQTAVTTQAMLAHPDMKAPAPAVFWQLPKDSNGAFFGVTTDTDTYKHVIASSMALLGKHLAGAQVPAADQKALIDSLTDLLQPSSVVVATGSETSSAPTAVKSSHGEDPIAEMFGNGAWGIAGLARPAAPIVKGLKGLGPAISKSSIAKAFGGTQTPVKIVEAAMPKGAWPKGSSHFVVSQVEPKPDATKPAKQTKTVTPPAVKHLLHIFVVPEGETTWLTVGFDNEAALATRARSVLASSTATARLGARDGLQLLHSASVRGGGFTTIAPVAAMTPHVVEAMPHHGQDPIVTLSEVKSDGTRGTLTTTIDLPRAVISDIVAGVAAAAVSH